MEKKLNKKRVKKKKKPKNKLNPHDGNSFVLPLVPIIIAPL